MLHLTTRHACRALVMVVLLALGSTACSSSVEPDSVDAIDTEAPGREFRGVGGSTDDAPEALAADDDEVSDELIGQLDADEPAQAAPDDGTESAEGEGPDGGADDPDPSVDDEDTSEPKSELDQLVDDLMTFVENERGHDFESRPELRLLAGDDFTDAFAALVERDAQRYAEDFENFTDIYRSMGVIDGSRDLAEIWSAFGDAGVLGYYDNEAKNIVLRGGEITPLTETILVHELTHALDDQIFEIDRPEYDDRDDEISWALSAIAEGNAQVIEARYRATLTDDERAAERTAQQNLPRGVSLSTFTMSFRELQLSRYRHGLTFVERLWADGVDAVDAAFVDPPPTSELIVDPSQYSPGAPGDPAAATPPAGGTVFESGVWGQIGWAAIFADVDPELAESAAEGWGGDWYVAWREGERTCVRANVMADSADALDNYADLLEAWATLGDRNVFYPTADLIRVTSCA